MKITNVMTDSNVGGAGVQIASLSKALSNDFDIEIIIPRGSMLKGRLSGCGAKVKELDFSADKSFSPRDVHSFHRFFHNNPCDILHTHAALSARLGALGTPVGVKISTRHCATPSGAVKPMGGVRKRLYNLCTDMTVSTAQYAEGNLIKEGVPRGKILTVQNGVAPLEKITEEERKALLNELEIPRNAIILGSSARLEDVKGQDLMIKALTRLKDEFPRLYLLLIGDGSCRGEYERLAARLGVLPRVRFTGYISAPSRLQNLFFLNINASRGTETSCLATSEAMSLGIPTVASSFGGNCEMIFHGKNGLIFRSDDSDALATEIKKLLINPSLYRKLSLGAEEIFKGRFSIEVMAEKYKRLYLELGKLRACKR